MHLLISLIKTLKLFSLLKYAVYVNFLYFLESGKTCRSIDNSPLKLWALF